jgi:2,3-dihydroxyphenylpropionate 1,2-dioxygenase
MISGAICISHTPVMDRSRAAADVEREFEAAIDRANRMIELIAPDLAVLFFPDHFNGFFYDLLPQFCVGIRGNSVGDFGTVPGALNINESLANSCAVACIRQGIDMAVSYKFVVDHGAAQPLELLSRHLSNTPIIPVFINCAAPPLTSFARSRELGRVVGAWASNLDQRVLFVASGGLSHDPPLPSFAKAPPEVQARLIDGRNISHGGRAQRQQRVFSQIAPFVKGTSNLLQINESWDRALIDNVLSGNLDFADNWNDEEVTSTAGCGAHEVRTWLAALAAVQSDTQRYDAKLEFYNPIKEWLTGTAMLTALPK